MLRYLLGWSALLLATLFSCFWAFWGCVESFHEGFTFNSIFWNLFALLIRYLPYAIIAIILNLVAIRNKWIGGLLYLSMGIFILYWFIMYQEKAVDQYWIEYIILLSFFPFIGFSLLVGKIPQKAQGKQFFNIIAIGLPVFVFMFVAVEPVQRLIYRFSTPINVGIYEVKYDENTTIQWAPMGEGWSTFGKDDWKEAYDICKELDITGKKKDENYSNPNYRGNGWRLPTPEEVIFSFPKTKTIKKTYKTDPKGNEPYYDKIAPLWYPYSPIIQLWCQYSNEQKNRDSLAPTVFYTGEIISQYKNNYNDSIGFRAVRIMRNGEVYNDFLDFNNK